MVFFTIEVHDQSLQRIGNLDGLDIAPGEPILDRVRWQLKRLRPRYPDTVRSVVLRRAHSKQTVSDAATPVQLNLGVGDCLEVHVADASAPRPLSSPSSTASSSSPATVFVASNQWECKQCTLLNDASTRTCAACEMPNDWRHVSFDQSTPALGSLMTRSRRNSDPPLPSSLLPMEVYRGIVSDHASLVGRATMAGVWFPNSVGDHWEWPDRSRFDPGHSRAWESLWDQVEVLPRPLQAELQQLKVNLARMQQDERGLDVYFGQMSHPTRVAERLHHASADGAARFVEHGTPETLAATLRVCLESKDSLSPALSRLLLDSVHVPLDDASPLCSVPSMTGAEFEQFIAAVRRAALHYQRGGALLVHCSQGQSRSGLFIVWLLLKLAATGDPLLGVQPRAPPLDRLCQAISGLAQQRKILDFSPRWHPILDYLARHSSVD